MRIDKLLWYLRFTKTRGLAQAMAEAGHIRLNGRRVERAHTRITPGDVLVLAIGDAVRAIALIALPGRRGPAAEAAACYRVLDVADDSTIAAAASDTVSNTAAAKLAAEPPATEGDMQP